MKKLGWVLIGIILLYILYPFLSTKKPFVIIGITPINVPTFEGYTFTKTARLLHLKKRLSNIISIKAW